MSLWTDIRDIGETVLTGGLAGAFNKRIGNVEGGLFNKLLGRPSQDDIRNQRNAINDQIKAYKDQTALEQKQLDETRAQTDVAKRQVQEKQIRSLRRNYRSQGLGVGMLGTGQPAANDMSDQLGG